MAKVKKPQIIEIKSIRKDLSGEVYGPWRINNYVHHLGTSPIWDVQCIYCDKLWQSTLPKIKRKRECECEDNLRWTSGVMIPNDVYIHYIKSAQKSGDLWSLSYIDLYKIYNRQNGVDTDGNKLIFDYHWNYTPDPPTCNYIWPDLNRIHTTSSYSLKNCYFTANPNQRYKKRRTLNLRRKGLT